MPSQHTEARPESKIGNPKSKIELPDPGLAGDIARKWAVQREAPKFAPAAQWQKAMHAPFRPGQLHRDDRFLHAVLRANEFELNNIDAHDRSLPLRVSRIRFARSRPTDVST